MSSAREQRQQKKRQKQKSTRERATARRSKGASVGGAPGGGLKAASEWPIYESYLSENWEEPGHPVTGVFSRRHPSGSIAAVLVRADMTDGQLLQCKTLPRMTESDFMSQLGSESQEASLHLVDSGLTSRFLHDIVARHPDAITYKSMKKVMYFLGETPRSEHPFSFGPRPIKRETTREPGVIDAIIEWFSRK